MVDYIKAPSFRLPLVKCMYLEHILAISTISISTTSTKNTHSFWRSFTRNLENKHPMFFTDLTKTSLCDRRRTRENQIALYLKREPSYQ